MTTRNTAKNLDGRDEFLLSLVAGFIPFVTLGAMIF